MNQIKIKSQLQTILSQTQKKIQALADSAREAIILPICKKHGLRYVAGNGITIFIDVKNENSIGNVYDAIHDYDGKYAFLAPIFDNVIDLEVDSNNVLGYYIDDVGWLGIPARVAKW